MITFDVVVFWDQVGWVAGTTTYNAVAQGATPYQAIKRLEDSLYIEGCLNLESGKVPFEAKTFDKKPIDAVRNLKPSIVVKGASKMLLDFDASHDDSYGLRVVIDLENAPQWAKDMAKSWASFQAKKA